VVEEKRRRVQAAARARAVSDAPGEEPERDRLVERRATQIPREQTGELRGESVEPLQRVEVQSRDAQRVGGAAVFLDERQRCE
jgi:hypothetical protein